MLPVKGISRNLTQISCEQNPLYFYAYSFLVANNINKASIRISATDFTEIWNCCAGHVKENNNMAAC
jgi:hypothetical protein